MTRRKRMKKLLPSLTASERALLLLRSWKEDTDEDDQIRLTTPAWQVREFNRYMGLMNGTNTQLGASILLLGCQIEKTLLRVSWLISVMQLSLCDGRPKATKPLATLSEALIESVELSFRSHWQELRAVELVVSEISEAFGGEDPLIPALRSTVEKAGEDLSCIHESVIALEFEATKEEPDDELVELVRSLVECELKYP